MEQIIPDNIRVHTRISENILSIMGDVTQLHQVLINLCTNARDAMPQGGELTVTAENTVVSKEMAEDYSGVTGGEYIVFSISDTGAGIPSSEIHKIFEPFYTTKEVGKGTGLGLSISIGIIKGHHGFITVESVIGKGSTFKIFLPVVSTVNAGTQEVQFQSEFNQPIIFIACSEDEYNDKLFDDLEDHGYEPLLAVGKTQVWETLIQNLGKVQTVIFDGFSLDETPDLMRDVLKFEPKVKLIVIARKNQLDEMKACEAPKLHAVLEQPVSIELLLEIIRQPLMEEEPSM